MLNTKQIIFFEENGYILGDEGFRKSNNCKKKYEACYSSVLAVTTYKRQHISISLTFNNLAKQTSHFENKFVLPLDDSKYNYSRMIKTIKEIDTVAGILGKLKAQSFDPFYLLDQFAVKCNMCGKFPTFSISIKIGNELTSIVQANIDELINQHRIGCR